MAAEGRWKWEIRPGITAKNANILEKTTNVATGRQFRESKEATAIPLVVNRNISLLQRRGSGLEPA
jgi:hypothetical protein